MLELRHARPSGSPPPGRPAPRGNTLQTKRSSCLHTSPPIRRLPSPRHSSWPLLARPRPRARSGLPPAGLAHLPEGRWRRGASSPAARARSGSTRPWSPPTPARWRRTSPTATWSLHSPTTGATSWRGCSSPMPPPTWKSGFRLNGLTPARGGEGRLGGGREAVRSWRDGAICAAGSAAQRRRRGGTAEGHRAVGQDGGSRPRRRRSSRNSRTGSPGTDVEPSAESQAAMQAVRDRRGPIPHPASVVPSAGARFGGAGRPRRAVAPIGEAARDRRGRRGRHYRRIVRADGSTPVGRRRGAGRDGGHRAVPGVRRLTHRWPGPRRDRRLDDPPGRDGGLPVADPAAVLRASGGSAIDMDPHRRRATHRGQRHRLCPPHHRERPALDCAGRPGRRARHGGWVARQPARITRSPRRPTARPECRRGRATVASMTSASLPAIRAYLAGREAFRGGRMEDAVQRFREATLLD